MAFSRLRKSPSLCPTWLWQAGEWPWLTILFEGCSRLIGHRLLVKQNLSGRFPRQVPFCPSVAPGPQAALGRQASPLPNVLASSAQGRRWCEQPFSKAELQLAFNLENVCCNKHTKMCFFQGCLTDNLWRPSSHIIFLAKTWYLCLYSGKRFTFLIMGIGIGGLLHVKLMFAFAAPCVVRDLIDSLSFSSEKLWDIWEMREACVYSLKATGNLVNIRYE